MSAINQGLFAFMFFTFKYRLIYEKSCAGKLVEINEVHKDNYLQGGRGIRVTLINQLCLFQTCTLDAIILCKHHNVALAHSNIFDFGFSDSHALQQSEL